MNGSGFKIAYVSQMARLTIFTEVSGMFIPWTSLVLITFGIKLSGIILTHTLVQVPNIPQELLGRRSKLNIWQMAITAKNCLMSELSGLMLKYIETRITATIKGKTLIMARSMFCVLKA
jgi:hypothetical protein